jgi:hypothetical protein
MDYIDLANRIRRLQVQGVVILAPLARTRAIRDGFSIPDIHITIETGAIEKAREADRVKFVSDIGVVFVAYTEDEASLPGAVIVSAFKHRNPN